jgi:DNA-binding XRE family transcriptional regulator
LTYPSHRYIVDDGTSVYNVMTDAPKSIMQTDPTDAGKISQTIRSLRNRLSLTQTELGHLVSVRKNTIYRYEAGISRPAPYTLLLLWRISETEEELRTFSPGLDLLVANQVGGRRALQERAS